MSRGFVDDEDQQPGRGLPLSGRDRLRRDDGPGHGQAAQAVRDQGHDALQGDQRRLRPGRPEGLLHRGQLRVPRPDRDRRRHGQEADAAAGRADRRHGRQPARQVDLGHPPPERLCDDRPDPAALCRLQPDPHLRIWQHAVRPRHFARRVADRGQLRRDRRHPIGAGLDDRNRSRREPGPRKCRGSTCRHRPRKASPSRPTENRFTEPAITPACRTSSASTSRRKKYEVVSNASTGFFRPMLQAGRAAAGL